MTDIKTIVTKYKRPLIVGGLILLVTGAYAIGHYNSSGSVAIQDSQPVQIPQDLLGNINALQNKLNISEQNANLLKAKLDKIQEGATTPVATFYVPSPSVEKAADVVQQQIAKNDQTLPPAALQKSDRTIVTPIIKDQNGAALAPEKQKVDVYKIDLRKDHRIKAGVTVVDGKAYGAVGYEQGRFEAIAHMQGKDIKGGTATWNIVEW